MPATSVYRQIGKALFWSLLLVWCVPQAEATTWTLNRLFIVSRLPHEPVASPGRRISHPSAPISLYLVIEGSSPGRLPLYFTEAPALDLGWGTIPDRQVRPWDDFIDGKIEISWSQLEPEPRSYDNLSPTFHYEPIVYAETPLPLYQNKWSFEVAIHPTLMPDQAPALKTGLGIGRFKVRIEHQKHDMESPGAAGSFEGGISDEVPWFAYRGLDSAPLVSWIQSRFNIPYVNGAGRMGKGEDTHQTMLGLGGDSIDLIVAGWRLAGHREVDFVGPMLLDPTHGSRATVEVTRARPQDGRYVAPNGDVVRIAADAVLPGDLIRSSKQAGVLARDLPPMGELNGHDIIVSALFREPRLEPLSASLNGPITILRWNEIRELQLDLSLLGYFDDAINGRLTVGLLSAIVELRSDVGLPPIDRSTLESMLKLRNGTAKAVPGAHRLEVYRRNAAKRKLRSEDRVAFFQRTLAMAAEELGMAGEQAMTWGPPLEGLDSKALQRSPNEPYRPRTVRFEELSATFGEVAQSFRIVDEDRDGRDDRTRKPVQVVASGAGVVVGLERGGNGKRRGRRARVLGNQLWIYHPRPAVLVGYLGLGEVMVAVGDTVSSGVPVAMVGRSGRMASKRGGSTRLTVVGFGGGEEGLLYPVDLAEKWGSNIEEHPLSSRPLEVQHEVDQVSSQELIEADTAKPTSQAESMGEERPAGRAIGEGLSSVDGTSAHQNAPAVEVEVEATEGGDGDGDPTEADGPKPTELREMAPKNHSLSGEESKKTSSEAQGHLGDNVPASPEDGGSREAALEGTADQSSQGKDPEADQLGIDEDSASSFPGGSLEGTANDAGGTPASRSAKQ